MTTTAQHAALHRRFEGVVVGEAENKTIRVKVDTTNVHAKYRKQYTTSRKYAVHDEKAEAHVGDIVLFEECRPLSKTKRHRLISVVKKA